MQSRFLIATLAGVWLACACIGRPERLETLGRLESEAEIHLYAEAFAPQAGRLTLSIRSVAAVQQDGTQTALEPLITELSGATMPHARLIAWGRLAPGAYVGFDLDIKRATLGTEGGTADLLIETQPLRIAAPFTATSRKANVLSLSLNYAQSIKDGFALAPVFSALVPPKTVSQLVGFCSNAGMDSLSVFDKRAHRVVGVLPTGRGPKGMALDPALGRAYVALSGDDAVQVVDIAAAELLNQIRLSTGDQPRELGLTPDRKLLLSVNAGSNTASFIDPSAAIELARVPTGEEPSALLMDRAGKRAYVFNRRSNNITVLDLANRSPAGTVPTEAQPLRGQLNRAATRLYVIHGGSAFMWVFSVPDFAVVSRVFVGLGMRAIKVDPSSDLIYVAMSGERRLYVYDPFSLTPVDTIDVPGAVSYLAIDDAENTLLMLMPASRSLAVMDLTSRKILSVMDVGYDPHFITLMGERS